MASKIVLNKWQRDTGSLGTLGMAFMLNAIAKDFDISYHDEILEAGPRKCRATTIYVDNYKIYLDFWEYAGPTHTEEVFNANFDLIIRLQHPNMTFDAYMKECKKNLTFLDKSSSEIKQFYDRIVPFSFFPSRILEAYCGHEKYLFSDRINQYGFFCGRDWKCRREYKKRIVNAGLEYISSQLGVENVKPLTDGEFIEKMSTSKVGIVLHGRHGWASDMKNRREIDYFMMKKPLVLNYKPHYYDELIDGEHYIYWDKQNILDLEKLYDLEKIAENGHNWYLRNATPSAISALFKKVLKDKLNID